MATRVGHYGPDHPVCNDMLQMAAQTDAGQTLDLP